MKIYVNDNWEIHDVYFNTKSDPALTEVEIIDDDSNPFKDWSAAKICCYKVAVTDGHVTMLTPYVDSRLIEHIDQLGRANERLTEENVEQAEEITGLGDAIIEMSEIIYA